MALTAREVVFFIRAENQASGAIRKVARDIGGLRNLKSVQDAAAKASIASGQKMARIEQTLTRNREAYNRALAMSGKLNRLAATGKASGGFTAQEIGLRASAATSAVVRLNREEELLRKDLDEARLAAAAQAAEFDRLGKAIPLERLSRLMSVAQRVGKVMQVTGVVIGAAFGVAASKAATFESQVTLAATQARKVGAPLGTVAQKVQDINAEILKQMREFPATSAEMADAFYQIFSGTNIQSVTKAAEMVKVFNQMAVAGGTDLKTMTEAGISLFNNFPNEFKNMTAAANAFFAAVRYGRTTPALFANSLASVLPVAKAAGLTFRDVADAMAFVTRQTGGRGTARDSTGLARLIEMFANKDVIAGLEKSGIHVKKVSGEMRPLLDIITEIHDKFVATGKLKPGPDTLNFFKTISAMGSGKSGTAGTIQGRRIFDFLITNIAQYHKVAADVNKDNDEMTKSFIMLSKSPGVRWQVFLNQMRALALIIGEQAIPVLLELGKPLVKLLKWFNDLSPRTKKLVAEIGVFGSVGLIAAGTILTLAGAVGHLYVAFKLLRLSGGIGAALGLGGAAGMTTPQVAILLGGLAALALLITKYPNLLHKMIDGIGGVEGAIHLLMIAVGGLMAIKLIGWLQGAAAQAVLTRTELAGVTGILAGLRALAPVVITLIILEQILKGPAKDFYKNHPGLAKTIGRIPGVGTAFGAGADLGDKAGKAFTGWIDRRIDKDAINERTKDMKAATDPTILSAFSTQIKHTKQLQSILDSPLIDDYSKGLARQAFNVGDWSTLAKIASKASLPLYQGKFAMGKEARTAFKTANDQTFMRQLKHVSELQKTYNKSKSLPDFIKFQNALKAINSRFNDENYQSYVTEYLSRVESADKKSNSKRLSAAQKAAKAYASQLSNAYANVTSTYNTLLQQNQSNFGNLFSGPWMQSRAMQARMSFNNQSVRPHDVLKDLRGQLSQFGHLNRAIDLVSKRGGPKSLTDQLRAAGPGALPDIEAINKLSGPQFQQYVATWQRSQKAIKAATMDQLHQQLATYRKFGSKVALAIIAGIKSEDPKLQNELERIINRMFPNLVAQAAKAPKTVPTGSKNNLAPQVVHHKTEHHFSPTIHNPESESIDKALAKAFFQFRNRKH